MAPRLPNFVIIGAPKCGTTSLHRYLSQHPDIYLPTQKELHFFTYPYIEQRTAGPRDLEALRRMTRTFAEYSAHYEGVRRQSAVGEVSPSYLYFAEAADAIRERLGAVKIVVILRNPVQKAYSQYLHLVRNDRETLGFYDALLAEERRSAEGWSDIWRYAESSLYTQRLKRYLEVFGAANVRILIFEEFFADTSGALRRLLAFLGVREVDLAASEVHHRSGKPRSRLLSSLLVKGGPASRVAGLLLPRSLTEAVQKRLWALNTAEKDLIDAQSMKLLSDYFRADVDELEALIGRPLPWFRTGT
jgi:hypothetical protein